MHIFLIQEKTVLIFSMVQSLWRTISLYKTTAGTSQCVQEPHQQTAYISCCMFYCSIGFCDSHDLSYLLIKVAASKSIIDRSYRVAELANYVDFVNLMGYDLHSFKWYLPLTGHNSPLYPRSDDWNMFGTVNLNWTAFYWVQLGMPREKIIVGVPTYGQTFLYVLSSYL